MCATGLKAGLPELQIVTRECTFEKIFELDRELKEAISHLFGELVQSDG